MNKAQAVMYLFPGADPLKDFEVWDDGDGQYIAKWDIKDAEGNPIPQPTVAELTTAWEAYLAAEAAKPPIKKTGEQLAELQANNAQLLLKLAQKELDIKMLHTGQANILLTMARNNIS